MTIRFKHTMHAIMISMLILGCIPGCDDSGGENDGSVEEYLEVTITGNGLKNETIRFDDDFNFFNNTNGYSFTFFYNNNFGSRDANVITVPFDVNADTTYITDSSYNISDYSWKFSYTGSVSTEEYNIFITTGTNEFILTILEWGSMIKGTFSGVLYNSGDADTVTFSDGTFQCNGDFIEQQRRCSI